MAFKTSPLLSKDYLEIKKFSLDMMDFIPNAAEEIATSESRDSMPIKSVEVLLQKAQIYSRNPMLSDAAWKLINRHNKLLKMIHADITKFMDTKNTGDILVVNLREIVYQHKQEIINNL